MVCKEKQTKIKPQIVIILQVLALGPRENPEKNQLRRSLGVQADGDPVQIEMDREQTFVSRNDRPEIAWTRSCTALGFHDGSSVPGQPELTRETSTSPTSLADPAAPFQGSCSRSQAFSPTLAL